MTFTGFLEAYALMQRKKYLKALEFVTALEEENRFLREFIEELRTEKENESK